ncbi:COG3650 family protein [Roseinatronobacter alkalisoli]|uniref:SH3 domain-containing protein n=1 Tax=Roseinatronobacter alkalisoli TaxID=3028235 RepID=A0ABT5T6M2_9RHOB|nr:SH3 domain-containing protein [Roseinatronobacter sp. HJB301]MDD7969603.1 SH3 domain-containing protein [Roseinatronobacter sp. HJB301]
MFRFLKPVILAVVLGAGAQLSAQEYPQLFDVVDVAADDVLNIRQAPSASSDVVGNFAADATGIEVIMLNSTQRWGLVNMDESTGWVFMRYLSGQGQPIDHYNMPVGLRCFGTEPFWSLHSDGGVWQYDSMDGTSAELEIEIAQDSGIAQDFRRMVRLSGPDGAGTAFIYPAMCNDGMSDRAYGVSISLMTGPATPLLSGCCSLSQ